MYRHRQPLAQQYPVMPSQSSYLHIPSCYTPVAFGLNLGCKLSFTESTCNLQALKLVLGEVQHSAPIPTVIICNNVYREPCMARRCTQNKMQPLS